MGHLRAPGAFDSFRFSVVLSPGRMALEGHLSAQILQEWQSSVTPKSIGVVRDEGQTRQDLADPDGRSELPGNEQPVSPELSETGLYGHWDSDANGVGGA